MPDRTGALFSLLNGKPAGLVARVDGAPVAAPTPAHCAQVGAALGAPACRVADVPRAPDESPRPRVVAAGGPRRAPAPRRRIRRRCSTPRSGSRPASAAASCRRARFTATSSATTCCSRATALRASSTSASRPPISSRTTSRSPSTTGASATARRSRPHCVEAMIDAYAAVRPLTADERDSVAGAAARGGTALLAVAPVRPAPAAPGRAHARARPGPFRTDPARARRTSRHAAGPRPRPQ